MVIVGSATAEALDYERGLTAQARDLGVDGQISFTGYRDDVARMMIAGDLMVIPSLTEAQPRVAVQAFATTRPVVASAVGGVPEIVVDGKTGWLVPRRPPGPGRRHHQGDERSRRRRRHGYRCPRFGRELHALRSSHGRNPGDLPDRH